VTFPSPQSRSLLEGEDVVWVRYTGSRDPLNVLRNSVVGERVLRKGDFKTIVSTGSAVALSFFPLARARRIDCHFIESVARGSGPSMTGRMMTRVPGVKLYTQWRSWESETWRYAGSVLDGFEAAPSVETPAINRAVVLLGTMEHGFRRLLDRLVEILPAEAEVLWQTGSTDASGLGIDARPTVPGHELEEAARDADVVIAHAGMGAALTVLETGRAPLLVPRSAARAEHIDDHQAHIAAELAGRGLAVSRDASELTAEDLARAASMRVKERREVPDLALY
jgi:UDP-N-acetylglucosamine transferase subunit ALG13